MSYNETMALIGSAEKCLEMGLFTRKTANQVSGILNRVRSEKTIYTTDVAFLNNALNETSK